MLTVLVTILKIIGIILLVILGLVLLILCLVLFAAVTYEAKADSEGSLEKTSAEVKVTWLFHLVRVTFVMDGKHTKLKVKLLWKSIIGGEPKPARSGKRKSRRAPEETGGDAADIDGRIAELEKELKEDAEDQNHTHRGNRPAGTAAERDASADLSPQPSAPEPGLSPAAADVTAPPEAPKQPKPPLNERIEAWIEKIKCTFAKFCDKINTLAEQKDLVLDFIGSEAHQKALLRLRDKLLLLLKRLTPKKFCGEVQAGFENPRTTGLVLALYSMALPVLGDHLDLQASFDEKVLSGSLYLRGRIRIVYFLMLLLSLIISKDVRTTIKDSRRLIKELKAAENNGGV